MKITRILKQGVPLWLLVTMLLAIVGGCAAPAKEEGEVRRVVEVKAKGSSLYYLR